MSGRMVRCANAPCERHTRIIGTDAAEIVWTCGEPVCPIVKQAPRTFGQPKQAKGGKKK